jgi:hypothetical protein
VKLICATICSFLFVGIVYAQDTTKTIKYIVKKDAVNIYIEIIPAIGDKKQTIYFLAIENDSSKNTLDTCFQKLVKNIAINTSIVKIIFNNSPSAEVEDIITPYANIIGREIISDVEKKYPFLLSHNIILAGINEGAFVAIGIASLLPEKVSKTAAFFIDYNPSITTRNDCAAFIHKAKGKLFIRTHYKDVLLENLNLFVDSLALKSSMMLYKIDAYEDDGISFGDGYNWLMADGNNYIIKTE